MLERLTCTSCSDLRQLLSGASPVNAGGAYNKLDRWSTGPAPDAGDYAELPGGVPLARGVTNPAYYTADGLSRSNPLYDASGVSDGAAYGYLDTGPHDASYLETAPHDSAYLDTAPHDATYLDTVPSPSKKPDRVREPQRGPKFGAAKKGNVPEEELDVGYLHVSPE